nr:MAG TPA: Protein of unknown function (DUF2514) [Caudoviricetes sp.]
MNELKYWKPLAALAVVGLLFGGWQADRRTQYRRGQADKAAEISLALAKAAQTQNENTLNQERQAQQKLHAAQAAIEKERNHAQTVAADMRRELNRLRRHADTHSRRLSAAAAPACAPDEDAARGWQLFAESAERYAELAETADAQRNDLAEWQAYGAVVTDSVSK